jgi:hypothetical protein
LLGRSCLLACRAQSLYCADCLSKITTASGVGPRGHNKAIAPYKNSRYVPGSYFCPLIQRAIVCQFGSFLVGHCRPPE